ncbi:hypothetical protein DXJ57_06275 [Vibrio fluvialis]|nr:hypothetical protein [Vibrio fluvialis]
MGWLITASHHVPS